MKLLLSKIQHQINHRLVAAGGGSGVGCRSLQYYQLQQQQRMNKSVLLSRHLSTKIDIKALSEAEVDASVNKLSQGTPFPWTKVEDRSAITKTFYFADFNQAWSFMSRTALLAEKLDHHPEWFNVYNRVEVTLTTHDCDGVSLKDIAMAKKMEEYAKELLPSRLEEE